MFTQDVHNNIGRHCTIGTGEGRVWEVYRAVTGSRYMVRHSKTGECRIVAHNRMSNLY